MIVQKSRLLLDEDEARIVATVLERGRTISRLSSLSSVCPVLMSAGSTSPATRLCRHFFCSPESWERDFGWTGQSLRCC